MKTYTNISFRKLFGTLFVLSLILFGASVIGAWTGPTQSPPEGNVAAPINVGSVDQVKDAALGVDGLAVFGSQYIQGNLGIGVESPTTALDVAGAIRMRGGGTPGAGKVLVATDGNGTLAWGTISYQEVQTSGPHGVYNLAASQTPGTPLYLLVQDMIAHGNPPITSTGTPYNDTATRARLCLALTGSSNATVLTYTTSAYSSPSNNYVYKWNGTQWIRYGAKGNNSFTSTVTCEIPRELKIVTDFGQTFQL